MPSWLLASLRTAAQYLTTAVVAWLASRGIPVPEIMQSWIAETVLFAGAIAAITAGLNWLASRRGDGFWSRAGRWVARIAMLGLSGKQPVYVDLAAVVRVDGVRKQ